MSPFQFACPSCGTPLQDAGPSLQRCPQEGTAYECKAGIWRLLPQAKQAYYDRFIVEYQAVRRAEQRGAPDAEYYRALPFKDLTGRFSRDWQIRARSYKALQDRVIAPLESSSGRSLRVLDLGAGNGWLSHRLARRGHEVAAVDLLTNAYDGLGAHAYYEARFTPVQADFTCPPFTAGQMDVVIFNASLHYSICYEDTLSHALQMLRSSGRLVILDSPIYHSVDSGWQMVREREAAFQRKYGFPSNAIPSENFLTFARLGELSRQLEIRWKFMQPFYGWRWALRPWLARLKGGREPAQFMLIVGQKRAQDVSNGLE